jgi:L-malate glycosyltransferase
MWSGHVGGAQRAVYQLVREQLRGGSVTPAVLFAQGEGPYWERMRELGCTTLDAGLANGRAFSRVGSIAAQMRPFDLVHCHGAEPLFILASLRCRGQLRVFTQRGGLAESYPPRKRLRYAMTGAVLRRRFHGLSGNTAHGAEAAGQLFGIDSSRFAVTYNGTEFELLEPTRAPQDVRAELGLPADCFVLGTASTLKGWKRVDRLVHALAALDRPELRLVVVGDGEERPRLEQLVDRLGVRSRTVFTGLRSDVADFLQCMDAFCLPSNARESYGNAAVEAMGMGLPTIVFADGGGTTEHIESGTTGFIVEDDDDLRRTLTRLLDDPQLRAAVGAAGRAVVRERYTPAAAARRYERLYEQAVGRARAARSERLRAARPYTDQ